MTVLERVSGSWRDGIDSTIEAMADLGDFRPGDCFRRAIIATDLLARFELTATLCHGKPMNWSATHFGKRFWHAWVELAVTGHHREPIALVMDPSQRTPLVVERTRYYGLGRIETTVWRFSRIEMLAKIDEHHHAGPWTDDDVEALIKEAS